jgi:hypothetical protein
MCGASRLMWGTDAAAVPTSVAPTRRFFSNPAPAFSGTVVAVLSR